MGQQATGAPAQPQQALFDQWNSNPGQYGSGIPPELLAGILNQNWRSAPSGNTGQFVVTPGQTTYGADAQGMSTGATTAPAEIQYHPQGQGPGEDFYNYDTNGKFLGTEKGVKGMSYAQGVLAVLGAAAGFGAIGAAAGGAGAADAAGAGMAGDSTAAGYGGMSAGDAATMGGGASVNGGAALGDVGAGGAAAGTGGAAFNSAADSQLANSQLGITGDQAAADAAAAPVPSVTVNGAASGGMFGDMNLSDALKIGNKVYGLMSQQGGGQGQAPVYSYGQAPQPTTFVGQAPGFAPIATQPRRNPMFGGLNTPWGSPYMSGLMGGFNG